MQLTEQIPRPPTRTNAELDGIINARGGLFRLEGDHDTSTVDLFRAIDSRLSRNIRFAEMELYRDKPREISVGFLCETSLNAFAYASPDEENQFDFIGINVGVAPTLLNIFSRILACSTTFLDVGSPEREDDAHEKIEHLTANSVVSGISPVWPQCPVRHMFAGELAQVALDFLFFHELTHLRSGHVDFLRHHLSMNALTEATSGSLGTDGAMMLQTLEIDADCGAILHTLNCAALLKSSTVQPTISLSERSAFAAAYGSMHRVLRTVSYASYIIFRLFDAPTWTLSSQRVRTHPSPPIRAWNVGATILELLRVRKEYGYDAIAFAKEWASFINDAEVTCGLVTNSPANPESIQSVANSPDKFEYLNSFKEHWKQIRPHLERYKRGGRLAE